MTRWDGFGRTLGFAALAAAGLPLVLACAGPWIGTTAALRAYLLLAAGVYAVGLSRRRSQRLAAAALALAAGVVLLALPLGIGATALGAACVVALGRSRIAQHQPPLRALAIELALAAAGLGAAHGLAHGSGLVGLVLAVWGYFLVQSGYFLIGGRSPRGDAPVDPFELARRRLERLLDDPGGLG